MTTADRVDFDPAPIPRIPPVWIWMGCAAFWALFTIAGVTTNLALLAEAGRPSDWPTQLYRVGIGTGLWLVASPLMISWSARHPVNGLADWRRVLVFLLVGVSWLVLATMFATFVRDGAAGQYAVSWRRLLSPGLFVELLHYAFFIAAGQVWAAHHRLRLRDAEVSAARAREHEAAAQLATARLNALRMHVQPHFVFNALNAVTALIRKGDAAGAIAMLIRLADFMRSAMHENAPLTVTLAQELRSAEEYLAIERVRFGDRLQVSITLDPAAAEVAVPHLILQPLIENAIRHGIAHLEHRGRIEISARITSDGAMVTIRNGAPTLSPDWQPTRPNGLGLTLTRRRLHAMYDRNDLLAVERESDGVITTLRIPPPQ